MDHNLGLVGVSPWGRRAHEYEAFFDLKDVEPCRILDCGAGPSSFTAEMTRRGWDVTAIDPIYSLDQAQIESDYMETEERIAGALCKNQERFVWNFYRSPEEVIDLRRQALMLFFDDYDAGRTAKRYVKGELPYLGLSDDSFDLALCSHFLFLYSDFLDLTFHVSSLLELSRIAREVRVFPLLKLNGQTSPFLQPVQQSLLNSGYKADIVPVPFEFQRGGNNMLRIRNDSLKGRVD